MQVGLGDVEFVELIFMTNNDKSWSLRLTVIRAGLWHEQEVRTTDGNVHPGAGSYFLHYLIGHELGERERGLLILTLFSYMV